MPVYLGITNAQTKKQQQQQQFLLLYSAHVPAPYRALAKKALTGTFTRAVERKAVIGKSRCASQKPHACLKCTLQLPAARRHSDLLSGCKYHGAEYQVLRIVWSTGTLSTAGPFFSGASIHLSILSISPIISYITVQSTLGTY